MLYIAKPLTIAHTHYLFILFVPKFGSKTKSIFFTENVIKQLSLHFNIKTLNIQ